MDKGGILYLHTDNPCLITLIQLYRVNYLLGISLCPRALQTHFLNLWSLPLQIWASFTIPPFSEHHPCPSSYACRNTRYLPAYRCIPYTFTQFFIRVLLIFVSKIFQQPISVSPLLWISPLFPNLNYNSSNWSYIHPCAN